MQKSLRSFSSSQFTAKNIPLPYCVAFFCLYSCLLLVATERGRGRGLALRLLRLLYLINAAKA